MLKSALGYLSMITGKKFVPYNNIIINFIPDFADVHMQITCNRKKKIEKTQARRKTLPVITVL